MRSSINNHGENGEKYGVAASVMSNENGVMA